MALTSYFDLGLSPVAVQRAAADTLQAQQTKHLAVAPALDLRRAIQSQTQARGAQQQLAIGERRLSLAEDRQAYDEAQLPWATAAGALSAGVQLYGGYQAWQGAEEAKVRADKNQAIQQETLRQQTEHFNSYKGIMAQIAQTYKNTAPYAPYTKPGMDITPLG